MPSLLSGHELFPHSIFLTNFTLKIGAQEQPSAVFTPGLNRTWLTVISFVVRWGKFGLLEGNDL